MVTASALDRLAPRVPLVDLTGVHRPIRAALVAAFERVLDEGTFVGGAEVEGFERDLARYVGTAEAVGVNSGTAALQLALLAAGIGAGDEVIVPTNTFFATAEAVLATGAVPVLIDVDPGTALAQPAAVEAAVGARTAAVIAVHLHGQPVDMAAMREVADRHRLFLLEDAAQAIGATWEGRRVGGLADAAAFSFYPGKNLGALGDAGAVTTNDALLAQRVRMYRSHGELRRHEHLVIGYTERLDALQAAMLRVKLPRLAAAQLARDEAVSHYSGLLVDVPGVTPLLLDPRARSVHHHVVVHVEDRDRVLADLHRRGVEAGVHYPTPVHLQPACRRLRTAPLPVAEDQARRKLSLPIFAGMTYAQVERVVDVLQQVVTLPGTGI